MLRFVVKRKHTWMESHRADQSSVFSPDRSHGGLVAQLPREIQVDNSPSKRRSGPVYTAAGPSSEWNVANINIPGSFLPRRVKTSATQQPDVAFCYQSVEAHCDFKHGISVLGGSMVFSGYVRWNQSRDIQQSLLHTGEFRFVHATSEKAGDFVATPWRVGAWWVVSVEFFSRWLREIPVKNER